MRRVAAIDCGTNSIRLLVAEHDVDTGALRDVAPRRMEIVRLGEGVDRTGAIAPAALERTLAACRDYASDIERLGGVSRTRFVATSATRDATNRQAFVTGVRDVLGVEPEVVSGDEEARLSFVGATHELDRNDGPFLVLDIGGGSTEFVLGTDQPDAARSVDMGCVRLTERHLVDDPPTEGQVEAARSDVRSLIEVAAADVPFERARTVVGLAGSVTTVAGIALGLSAYDSEVIHGSRVSATDVRAITEKLLHATHEERARIPVMHPGRVDVIGGGALVLDEILQRVGAPEVVVSEHDILDGIAWSVLR